jgi:hypothetical protein
MSVRAWIDSRTPAPPAALGQRVAQALGKRADDARISSYDACLESAIGSLADLLVPDALGRESAADLLAADALVTYAFEAAAEDISQLDARASSAMLQLAALANRAE